jgi:hypothetical protein
VQCDALLVDVPGADFDYLIVIPIQAETEDTSESGVKKTTVRHILVGKSDLLAIFLVDLFTTCYSGFPRGRK